MNGTAAKAMESYPIGNQEATMGTSPSKIQATPFRKVAKVKKLVDREAMGESMTCKGLEALMLSGKYPLGLQTMRSSPSKDRATQLHMATT